jgi:hypothetical protein
MSVRPDHLRGLYVGVWFPGSARGEDITSSAWCEETLSLDSSQRCWVRQASDSEWGEIVVRSFSSSSALVVAVMSEFSCHDDNVFLTILSFTQYVIVKQKFFLGFVWPFQKKYYAVACTKKPNLIPCWPCLHMMALQNLLFPPIGNNCRWPSTNFVLS